MKKCYFVAVLVLISILIAGCSNDLESVPSGLNAPEESTAPEATQIDENAIAAISGSSTMVFAMYENGYSSIDSLMDQAVLIVRATPVSIEAESDLAVCYVLDVGQSSIEGIETIRLRQMKDEYQLEIGQEVVLALAPDEGEGYYHIPAGGAGLFTVNEATNAPEGELLDDLLEHSPASLSAEALITLEDVFNLLCNFE